MKKLSIIFFGSDSWSIYVLKALEDSSKGRSASGGNFDVVAVICAPDSPVSRYFKGQVLTPDKLDENFIRQLGGSNFKFDLAIVASYGKIIPQTILKIPKFGFLNIHPSLLPKYRGPSPVPETILNGDKITGVTIIKMDEKMDHGSIIFTKEIRLSGIEDFPTLINKLFREGAKNLVKVIPEYIAGKIKPVEQKHDVATYCPLLTRESGYFDIENPPSSEKLDRMIRAYYPWPGVWTKWNNKIVKFLPVPRHPEPLERHSELVSESQKSEIPKRVRDDDIFLIQMEGKKPKPLKDFLNGYPDFPKIC